MQLNKCAILIRFYVIVANFKKNSKKENEYQFFNFSHEKIDYEYFLENKHVVLLSKL